MSNVIYESSAQMWTIVLVGISTVFLCLIALVAMVSFFKRVFVPGAKKVKLPQSNTPSSLQNDAEKSAGSAASDHSIVAAIAAAISAASGVPVSSFRIASIDYSGFNTPAWGHVDRAGHH
ncbi:hypothetical protein MASR2M29_22170 [Spirochaetota bacterium]